MQAQEIINIFNESINDYHVSDSVDTEFKQKYANEPFKALLYQKNWIDTVQWHYEDIVRDGKKAPEFLLEIKRKIDKSNQHRTDVVELIDEYFYSEFSKIELTKNAKLNSETPAWLLDRISILALKIYHFNDQIQRQDIDKEQFKSVSEKLYILKIQERDMLQCFNELMVDYKSGQKIMKLYKQMKMYNDPNLNPVLYGSK